MAMNIITKEKKEIKWIGLPTNAKQELEQLEVKEFDLHLSNPQRMNEMFVWRRLREREQII